jgi:hypothetical protein
MRRFAIALSVLILSVASSAVIVVQDDAGYDEILRPNADGANMKAAACPSGDACATFCNDTGPTIECYQKIDEDVSSPDGDVILSTTTGNNSQSYFELENPSSDPSAAAGAQRFVVVVSHCTDDDGPAGPPYCEETAPGCSTNFYLYLSCGGVRQIPPIANAVAIGGDGLDEVHEIDWTMDVDCLANGSDTGFVWNVTGCSNGQPEERVSCLEALEWHVKH